MKRKLVLTFDGNKLLHATITERGRRTRLPAIASSKDALREVKDTLTCALSAVETASVPTILSDVSTTSGAMGRAEMNYREGLSMDSNTPSPIPSSDIPDDISEGGGGTYGIPSRVVAAPDKTVSVASMQDVVSRSRSVCARPKVDNPLPPPSMNGFTSSPSSSFPPDVSGSW